MHSFHWEHPDPDPQYNDPSFVVIHHNGNYSGQAKVIVHYGHKVMGQSSCTFNTSTHRCTEVEVPAWALIAFAEEAVRDEFTRAIEAVDIRHGAVSREEKDSE